MHVVALVALVVAFACLCVHLAQRHAEREEQRERQAALGLGDGGPGETPGDRARAALAARREAARQRRLPLLPPDDQPPSGLRPLIPSQRNVSAEVVRGLRDLSFYLAERRSS